MPWKLGPECDRYRAPEGEKRVTLAPGELGDGPDRAQGREFGADYIMGDFPQPGAIPIVLDGQVIGSMGVSSGDGEKCAQAGVEAVFGKTASAST
jgi:hypothetical protein